MSRVLLLFCLARPAVAQAQDITSPYRFLETRQSAMVFGGYLSTSRGALLFGPESAPIVGARYDLIVSGPFALEAEVGRFSSTRMVWDTVPGDTTRERIGDADFGAISGLAALRFNLTGARTYHRLLPYLMFGLGALIETSAESPAEEDLASDLKFDFGTSFAGVLGGGIEWLSDAGLGLRFDARNILWKLKTPRGFLLREDGARLPGDEWSQNFSFTAGFVYHF
ncbi:MAG: hypothetical protein ACREL7_04950 [Longimicrobiales bacterium]